ncbi:MAG: hypothetical protein OSB26_07775 [Woeseiaceae bacterium]|nr:hypothetical protein [Woeseiaceae bacterium]
MLQSSESLQVSMHTGVWNAQEYSIDDAMWMLRAPLTTDLGSGVRDSLISAGRIDILSDLELRYELAEWGSVLDELLDDQLGNRSRSRNYPAIHGSMGCSYGHWWDQSENTANTRFHADVIS